LFPEKKLNPLCLMLLTSLLPLGKQQAPSHGVIYAKHYKIPYLSYLTYYVSMKLSHFLCTNKKEYKIIFHQTQTFIEPFSE